MTEVDDIRVVKFFNKRIVYQSRSQWGNDQVSLKQPRFFFILTH